MLKHTFEVCNEEVDLNHQNGVQKAFWLLQLSDVQWVGPPLCDESKLRTCAWSGEVTRAAFTEIHSYISVKIYG